MGRRVVVAVLLAAGAALPSAARAQDDPKELKAKYDDAVAQLKAAQDRKNELSVENDALKQRVADLEGQVKSSDDTWAERTFHLRAANAAWTAFLRTRPALKGDWDRFISAGPVVPDPLVTADLVDEQWPLSAVVAPVPTEPATAPASRPTSRPATVPATLPGTVPATRPSTDESKPTGV